MNTANKRERSTTERRQLLVETAIKCFSEKGFHQTSMRDLATRAGISLGNLYNHFGSKTELIKEIATLEAVEVRQLQILLNASRTPQKALDRFVLIYLEACTDPDSALLFAEIVSEGLRNPEIRGGFQRNREALLSILIQILHDLEAAKGATLRMPAEDCAAQILDLIEGLSTRLAFAGKLPTRKERASLNVGIDLLIGR